LTFRARQRRARVVERAFAEPCARTDEDIIFFAFVAVDRSFVAVGTRARWCESRDVMSSCDAHNVACVNTDVADGEVLSAFAAYVGVALVVLTAFGCVRAHVPIYTGRCHLRSLKMSGCAPRERRARGVGGAREKCGEVFGWIVHVLAVSDSELVETAGLDALVFLRISQFGTQLFAPLALAGVLALAPAHMSQTFYTTTVRAGDESRGRSEGHMLMKMTIANIEPKSPLMWMHVVMCWVSTVYALWLLNRHYRSYEFLRQVYGTTTGESNPWRAVHIPQTVLQKLLQQGIDTNREFTTEMNEEWNTTQAASPQAREDASGTQSEGKVPKRRHSTIGTFRKGGQRSKSIGRTKYTPLVSESRGEQTEETPPTSVENVEWPMLLELLLGPNRSTNHHGLKSTEQKLKRFPRSSMVADSAVSATRGYHSHMGPVPCGTPPLRRPAPTSPIFPVDSNSSLSEISVTAVSDSDEVETRPSTLGVDDIAITHKWWEGLDIAAEAWENDERPSSRGEDQFGSSETLSVRPPADLEAQYHESNTIDRPMNPVPSIDDRRYVCAIADEIDENGQSRGVAVSVLVQNYCVLMTDIGEEGGDQYEDMRAVEKFFTGLFPEDFFMLIPLRDHRTVDDLLTERDKLVNEIEKCEIQQSRRRRRKRSMRTRDEVTELREQVASIEHLIVQERAKILRAEPGPSCIVAFKSQYAAACAAQCRITSRRHDLFNVEPAPGPDNLNWQSILLRKRQRELRSLLMFPLILAVILIPTGMFTGVMSSLCVANQFGAKQNEALSWYCSSDAARFLRILVQGILPPILLTLWETFVVSFGMMYLVQAQSKYSSLSKTDESFAEYYFLWAFLNVFFGTVSGYAIQRYLNALNTKGPDAMLTLLGTSLPLTSNFFLLWIVFRGVYLPTQRLIFPHPGVLCMIVNKWLCCLRCGVTPRDRTIKYSPRSVRLGREVGVFTMVMMIGLVFATVAPLITLLCAVFFVFNFVIWRYHVLYVYERSYEAGGTMWVTFCNLTIYSLMIAQSFLSFVLLSKQAYAGALILWITVLPVLNRASHRFRAIARELQWVVPLPQASTAPRVEFDAEMYIHPALKRNSIGWHPEISKVWRGYPNVTVKETRIFR